MATCPKCKSEYYQREGYIGNWFILNDDGTNDLINDLNAERNDNLWREDPDKQRWVCLDCNYVEEIKGDENESKME